MWIKSSHNGEYTYLDLGSVSRLQTQQVGGVPPYTYRVQAFFANETVDSTVAEGFASPEEAATWIDDVLKNVKED